MVVLLAGPNSPTNAQKRIYRVFANLALSLSLYFINIGNSGATL